VQRGEAIFAGEEAAKPSGAGGESAQHDTAVGDAFVAWNGELGLEFADGTNFDLAHGAGRLRRMWAAFSKILVKPAESLFSMAAVSWVREV